MIKFSSKLDFLQAMSQTHLNEPHKVFMIELLAEHADDPDMTAEFLQWLENSLNSI